MDFKRYLPFGGSRQASQAAVSPVAKRAPGGGSSFKELGTTGTPITGGFVINRERDPALSGIVRYQTYSDIMANVSIVAAGMRFFLGLASRPTWKIEPAKDQGDTSSDAAKAAAEFVESILSDMSANMTRIVRRSGMYRFYGFGIHEWTAKRRDDGLIGIDSIEVRPCHTIERWEVDKNAVVEGVWQQNWQGSELYIPRRKFIYLLDDTLTDSPEGFGLFRHMVEPARRLNRYLKLEGQGYERDLRGIPVGRAPLAEIAAAVDSKTITAAEGAAMTAAIEQFIQLQVKEETTGILLDSSVVQGQDEGGDVMTNTLKWGMELLSAEGGSFADIGKAIERCRYDLAMIIGTENLLVGSGDGGSRALSADKSRNLYLQANSTVKDLAEAFDRDLLTPIWALNGLPDELKPSIFPEDVSFQDAESVAATLRDMASAGAVLAPDDPIIQDMRDLMGMSRAPDRTEEEGEDEMLRRASADAARQAGNETPGRRPADSRDQEQGRGTGASGEEA